MPPHAVTDAIIVGVVGLVTLLFVGISAAIGNHRDRQAARADAERFERTLDRLSADRDAINESVRLTITATAEAIGRAVQTATFAPADPIPSTAPVEHAFDADIEAGVVDMSDPTDAAMWLQRERTSTAPLVNGDNPFGIEGLRASYGPRPN